MALDTRMETITADNGATIVLATIVHDGHEFTAGGGSVDLDNGHVYAYVDDRRTRGKLTLWNGETIGQWTLVSTWGVCRQRECYTMRAITAHINGDNRTWKGRYGSDWSQLVHLTPMKSL